MPKRHWQRGNLPEHLLDRAGADLPPPRPGAPVPEPATTRRPSCRSRCRDRGLAHAGRTETLRAILDLLIADHVVFLHHLVTREIATLTRTATNETKFSTAPTPTTPSTPPGGMFTTIGGVATASVTDSYADDSAALHGTDSHLDDFLTAGRAALADLADQRHVLKRMHQRNRACRPDRYAPSNLDPSLANQVNFSRTEPNLTRCEKAKLDVGIWRDCGILAVHSLTVAYSLMVVSSR
ncbi:hypothetical protein GGF32_005018 [Allomyces javanicus]|nr:hypothetical protein GGF32_005018 [Allomyces javanicus]